MAKYIFRIDDIAPNMRWDLMQQLETLFDTYGVSPLLGVIPDNKDPKLLRYDTCAGDFWAQVRCWQDKGWSIALHGYQHVLNQDNGGILGVNGFGEFAGLPSAQQEAMLGRGLSIFKDQGIITETFMAPAHSYDANTLLVLKSLDFRTLTDGMALFPYYDKQLLFVPQQCATPRAMPFGVFTFCIHPNALSDEGFRGLQAFVKQNSERVIGFPDAKRYCRGRVGQKAVEVVLKAVLGSKRALKR